MTLTMMLMGRFECLFEARMQVQDGLRECHAAVPFGLGLQGLSTHGWSRLRAGNGLASIRRSRQECCAELHM